MSGDDVLDEGTWLDDMPDRPWLAPAAGRARSEAYRAEVDRAGQRARDAFDYAAAAARQFRRVGVER